MTRSRLNRVPTSSNSNSNRVPTEENCLTPPDRQPGWLAHQPPHETRPHRPHQLLSSTAISVLSVQFPWRLPSSSELVPLPPVLLAVISSDVVLGAPQTNGLKAASKRKWTGRRLWRSLVLVSSVYIIGLLPYHIDLLSQGWPYSQTETEGRASSYHAREPPRPGRCSLSCQQDQRCQGFARKRTPGPVVSWYVITLPLFFVILANPGTTSISFITLLCRPFNLPSITIHMNPSLPHTGRPHELC